MQASKCNTWVPVRSTSIAATSTTRPTPGPGAVATRRPNKLFGQIRTIANDLVSAYQGMSIIVRQRFSRGLQFQANYTWSHSLDVSTRFQRRWRTHESLQLAA